MNYVGPIGETKGLTKGAYEDERTISELEARSLCAYLSILSCDDEYILPCSGVHQT